MGTDQHLMTAAEVATRFRVSRPTVLRWVKNGELRALRLPGGRAYRFWSADVDAYEAANTVGGGEAA